MVDDVLTATAGEKFVVSNERPKQLTTLLRNTRTHSTEETPTNSHWPVPKSKMTVTTQIRGDSIGSEEDVIKIPKLLHPETASTLRDRFNNTSVS